MFTSNLKISELLERFYRERQHLDNIKLGTIWSYKTTFNPFIRENPKIQNIRQLTLDVMEEFIINGRINKEWQPPTIHNAIKAFRAFGKWCVKRKYYKENPALGLIKPRLNKPLPKALSKEKAQLVIDTAFNTYYAFRITRYKNRALVAIMIYAGLRVNECVNLKLHEVDFENNTIFIKNGKGSKDRLIPMCSQLKQYMAEYLKERKRLKRTHIYFFSSSNKDMGMTTTGVKKTFELLKNRLGFHLTAHYLRHTFATLMLEGGCDIYSLSLMMGHSDISTTTIYLKATPVHLLQQIIKHPLN